MGDMEYLKIRNWEKWQTYRKDRGQPPWIKVHRRLMRKPKWVQLTDSERGQVVSLWLLGADRDGLIPDSAKLIQKLCYLTKPPNLKKFVDLRFLETTKCQPKDDSPTTNNPQNDQPKAEAKAEVVQSTDDVILTDGSIPKIKEEINKLCEQLYGSGAFPLVHAFKNKMLKEKKHSKSILHALIRCSIKKPKPDQAWGYCLNIIEVESGNYYEADHGKSKERNN